jgi:uncharacterized protein (TIGR00268 family)
MSFNVKELCESIKSQGSALIALSGGVDSSVVAALAKKALGDRAIAVTIDNGLLRTGEAARASRVAAQIGIRHTLIYIDVLSLPGVSANVPKRCYHCKTLMFSTLQSLARELALEVVIDGTTASDLEGYRPGVKALQELDVRSPLINCTKEQVIEIARMLGLTVADAPSTACLLTRFPYNTYVTHERLERVRKAEEVLQSLGIAQVRVRDHEGIARIEVERGDHSRLIEHAATVSENFIKLGFSYVTLDLQWFRSGSMDRTTT